MRRSRVQPTLNRAWWNAYLRRQRFRGFPRPRARRPHRRSEGRSSPQGARETPDAGRARMHSRWRATRSPPNSARTWARGRGAARIVRSSRTGFGARRRLEARVRGAAHAGGRRRQHRERRRHARAVELRRAPRPVLAARGGSRRQRDFDRRDPAVELRRCAATPTCARCGRATRYVRLDMDWGAREARRRGREHAERGNARR